MMGGAIYPFQYWRVDKSFFKLIYTESIISIFVDDFDMCGNSDPFLFKFILFDLFVLIFYVLFD